MQGDFGGNKSGRIDGRRLRISAMHEANTALLDYRPGCPEVADFAVFCIIHTYTYPPNTICDPPKNEVFFRYFD